MLKYSWNYALLFWIGLFLGRLLGEGNVEIRVIIGASVLVFLPTFLAYMAGIEYQKGKVNE